uniref:Uncharacterized protein n=1 Tax=Caenorhabditis tropicalis TaxID=1561998 RepID=A0A1I7TLU0_9PELO
MRTLVLLLTLFVVGVFSAGISKNDNLKLPKLCGTKMELCNDGAIDGATEPSFEHRHNIKKRNTDDSVDPIKKLFKAH